MGVVSEAAKFLAVSQTDDEDQDSRRREKELRLDQGASGFLALDAQQRGEAAAGLAAMSGTRLGARQRVAYTTAGVDASVGTAADVIAETAMTSELDRNTIRNNAAREAWGHKRTAEKLGKEADLARDEPNRKVLGRVLAVTGAAANVVGSAAKMGS